MNTELFEKFSPALRATKKPISEDSRLLIETDGELNIYYTPFEYVNAKARIVLVGITPGPTQMESGNNIARESLLMGASSEEAMMLAKKGGAFNEKTMRSNLNKELNHWGINDWLGITHSDELFNNASHLVQSTSLLRYPVFVKGKPYSGTPNMTKNTVLRKYLLNYFVNEIVETSGALIFPLGAKVQSVISDLVAKKLIDPDVVMNGLMHPSGNNTYRINYLISDRKEAPPHRTNPQDYDNGRNLFRKKYL
jgi:hypothetical protein